MKHTSEYNIWGKNMLDSSSQACDHGTRRIWSLWEIMKTFKVDYLANLVASLKELEGLITGVRKHSGEVALSDSLKSSLTEQFKSMRTFCSQMTLIECLPIIEEAEASLSSSGLTLGVAKSEIAHARAGIEREIARWQFVPVSADSLQYFEKERLFGDEVFDLFKDARYDVSDAGNCIAVDLPTAAVFHLMRVAEHGLRFLARRLRVKLTHGGRSHPIEFADWGKVITGCKNEITKARSMSPSTKRQAKLELYSDAADHCVFMKDIWRNTMAHTRKRYIGSESAAVHDRVRDFMKFLATEIA